MSWRGTPTEALKLLAPELSPTVAAAKLTWAINHEACQAYCHGVAIEAHIAAIARVVPKLDNNGRWTADIESTGPGLGWARGLNWELEIDDPMALKPQPDTRAEAVQAAATAAAQAIEASATSAAAQAKARAEIEQARAEMQAATEQVEKVRAEMQAAAERMEMAEARVQAAEARVEAMASTTTGNLRRRRPPGPKPARNWQEHVLCEVIRALSKGRPRPSGPDLAQSCLDNLNHVVDVSAINKLLRDVLEN